MKKILVPGVLGGLVIFVWTFISWTVLPWHNSVINEIPNGEAMAQAMKSEGMTSAVYHFPGMPENDDEAYQKAWAERFLKGPNINFMVYSTKGSDMMDPVLFLRSLILNILAALLASYLLLQAMGSTSGLLQRALFVTALGAFVAITYPMAEWNWWNFPTDFTLVAVADTVITWFLAGLVIAWRLKPETA